MGEWDSVFLALAGVLGVVALMGLAWGLLWDRSRGRKRCPRCWYDMDAVPRLVCPECGRAVATEAGLRRTRRRWGRVLAACGVGVLAWGVGVTPRVVRDGWGAAAPLWALTALAPWFEDRASAVYRGQAAAPAWAAAVAASGPAGAQQQPGAQPLPPPRITAPAPPPCLNRWERVLAAHECERRINQSPSSWPVQKWSMVSGPEIILANLVDNGPEADPVLLRMLRSSEHAHTRRAAAWVLGQVPPERMDRVVGVLGRAYPGEGDARAKLAMLRALLVFHPGTKGTPYLIEMLRDPDEQICEAGCQGLMQLGKDAAAAEADLVEVATTRGESAATKAVIALHQIGPSGVAALAGVLTTSPSPQVRRAAAEALAVPGTEVSPAATALLAALKDPHPGVRATAAVALGRCRGCEDEAVRGLVERLGLEPEPEVRVSVATSLGRVGRGRAEAVAALAALLGDESEPVRYAAAMQLADFGAPAAPARDSLAAALADRSERVRREVERAMGAIDAGNGAGLGRRGE